MSGATWGLLYIASLGIYMCIFLASFSVVSLKICYVNTSLEEHFNVEIP